MSKRKISRNIKGGRKAGKGGRSAESARDRLYLTVLKYYEEYGDMKLMKGMQGATTIADEASMESSGFDSEQFKHLSIGKGKIKKRMLLNGDLKELRGSSNPMSTAEVRSAVSELSKRFLLNRYENPNPFVKHSAPATEREPDSHGNMRTFRLRGIKGRDTAFGQLIPAGGYDPNYPGLSQQGIYFSHIRKMVKGGVIDDVVMVDDDLLEKEDEKLETINEKQVREGLKKARIRGW